MKTVRDVFIHLEKEHGIRSSAMFHADLDQPITDEEYQNHIDLMVKIQNSNIWDDDDE